MTTRRVALCAGVPEFGTSGYAPLPFVRDRVAAVAHALTGLGYAATEVTDPARLSGADLVALVRRSAEEAGPDGVLVIHLVSHGHLTDSGALHLIGADGVHTPESHVGEWVRWFTDFPGLPRTLLLLDVCHAGTAARQTWQLTTADTDQRCWVLAACASADSAFNGRFSEAVATVLGGFGTGPAQVDAARPHLPLRAVAAAIRREVKRLVERDDAMSQEVVGSLRDFASEMPDLPFFPNPGFVPYARRRSRPPEAVAPFADDVDEALDPAHFMERAGGRGTPSGKGCFSGRNQELNLLTRWSDGKGPWLRVVTGSPGAGKSALLGIVVCAAHPALREPTSRLWKDVAWTPDENRRLVAVHARQRTLDEIETSLSAQLGIDGPLLDRLPGLPAPPFVVIDALDEAHRHERVMTRLVLPLAGLRRDDGSPACHLLVGMRPWDTLRPLREAAGDGLIDLDETDPAQLGVDLEDYVVSLLRFHEPYGTAAYAGARGAFAAHLAEALTRDRPADRWGEFLVAGLYTHHVATAYEPMADVTTAERYGSAVPRTLPELLELDLAARANPWLRPVLTTLAHARGEGMPAELIHDAAPAFAPDGTAVTRADRDRIAAALRVARFHLRTGTDTDGTTLYRLFHQGLADYLRRDEDTAAAAGRLAATLLAPLADMDGPGRRWDLAEPYLRRHLADHCVEAGRTDLLAGDLDFLVHADEPAVCTLLEAAPVAWLDAAEYGRIRRTAGTSPVARRQALAVQAALAGATGTAHELTAGPDGTALRWRVRWALPSEDPADPAVLSVQPGAAIRLVKWSGLTYLAYAAPNGEVGAWSLDGRMWSAVVDGRAQPLLEVHGNAVVVTDAAGKRHVWHLEAGRRATMPAAPPPPAGPAGDAVVATESGPLLLTADPRGGIRMYRRSGTAWTAAGWQPTRRPVRALTGIAAGARLTLVYADGDDLTVTVRNLRKDLTTDRAVLATVPGVQRIAALVRHGRLCVATAGPDVRLYRFDPRDWSNTDAWTAPAAVSAVAGDGAGHVAVSRSDGRTTVHAAATGAVVGELLNWNRQALTVAFGPPPRSLLALLHVGTQLAVGEWDTGRFLYRSPIRHRTTAVAVTDLAGRPVVLTDGGHGPMLLDLATRTSRPIGAGPAPDPERPPPVLRAGGRRLVAEWHRTGLRIIDLAANRQLGRFECGRSVRDVAVAGDGMLAVRFAVGVVLLSVQT